jgi:hypothetical protein
MSMPNSAVRVRYIGDDLSITTYVHEYTGYAWPVADDRDEPGDVADVVGLMVFVPDDDPRKRFEVRDEDLEELAE